MKTGKGSKPEFLVGEDTVHAQHSDSKQTRENNPQENNQANHVEPMSTNTGSKNTDKKDEGNNLVSVSIDEKKEEGEKDKSLISNIDSISDVDSSSLNEKPSLSDSQNNSINDKPSLSDNKERHELRIFFMPRGGLHSLLFFYLLAEQSRISKTHTQL